VEQSGYLVGYARVSTEDQSLALQVDALTKAGVLPNNMFVEKVSGASKKRPQLEFAIKDLRPGDTLVVWRLDRLARSMRQLYATLDAIIARGASFRSLSENFDINQAMGRLYLAVAGAFAEFERELISERTKAGIAAVRARRKDATWGPAVYMTPERIKRVGELLNGGMSGPAVAKKMGISTASVYAHWKQSGHGRFVRKRKSAGKGQKD
jgi:DNA invertase Pin-like site-specific DNA recombinase